MPSRTFLRPNQTSPQTRSVTTESCRSLLALPRQKLVCHSGQTTILDRLQSCPQTDFAEWAGSKPENPDSRLHNQLLANRQGRKSRLSFKIPKLLRKPVDRGESDVRPGVVVEKGVAFAFWHLNVHLVVSHSQARFHPGAARVPVCALRRNSSRSLLCLQPFDPGFIAS